MMPIFSKTNITEYFHVDSRGFLYLHLSGENENYIFTAEKIAEYIDIIANTCNEKTNILLIDARGLLGGFSIQKTCYRLLVRDIKLNTVCKKAAFITDSSKLSLKVENYINRYKPKVNTKVFNSLEKAIDYCTAS